MRGSVYRFYCKYTALRRSYNALRDINWVRVAQPFSASPCIYTLTLDAARTLRPCEPSHATSLRNRDDHVDNGFQKKREGKKEGIEATKNRADGDGGGGVACGWRWRAEVRKKGKERKRRKENAQVYAR